MRKRRVSMVIASCILGLGLLGPVIGLIHTYAAMSTEGLSQSDRQRILSNGIAEAEYNFAVGLFFSSVAFFAGWWARGRATQQG